MASYTSSAGTHSNDASKFCDICQRDASATHYSSPAHLLTLTNFATRLAHTTSTTRTNILQVAKSCKGMTKKLERIKPAMQQERHLLYFWTGLHSHEGLNLRHGACLLTPSTDRAQSGVASPSPSSGGTSSPNSLHTEPCNLLYVNGQNAYAALPPVHLTQAGASFSFLVKFHSCQLNHAELLRLRVANNDSNADGVSISVHQSKGISVTYWRGRDDHRACHADFDAVKLGQWHHVFTVIQPGSMRLWIDGTLVAKAEGFPLGMAEGTRSWNAIGQKCHAAIKDVRIWAVPLDMDEMAKVEKSLKEMYT